MRTCRFLEARVVVVCLGRGNVGMFLSLSFFQVFERHFAFARVYYLIHHDVLVGDKTVIFHDQLASIT